MCKPYIMRGPLRVFLVKCGLMCIHRNWSNTSGFAYCIQEVNEGVQALLDNPKLRSSPAFAAEFADDHIWPI